MFSTLNSVVTVRTSVKPLVASRGRLHRLEKGNMVAVLAYELLFPVHRAENCAEDSQLHYRWPESRPTVTQRLPCFPNKEQGATRTW